MVKIKETGLTLGSSAYEAIRFDIMVGRFKPGEKQQFDTAAPTLRYRHQSHPRGLEPAAFRRLGGRARSYMLESQSLSTVRLADSHAS